MATNQIVMTLDIAGGTGTNIVVTHHLETVVDTGFTEAEIEETTPVTRARVTPPDVVAEVTTPEVTATVEVQP